MAREITGEEANRLLEVIPPPPGFTREEAAQQAAAADMAQLGVDRTDRAMALLRNDP